MNHAQRKMSKDEKENRDAYVAMGNVESDDSENLSMSFEEEFEEEVTLMLELDSNLPREYLTFEYSTDEDGKVGWVYVVTEEGEKYGMGVGEDSLDDMLRSCPNRLEKILWREFVLERLQTFE